MDKLTRTGQDFENEFCSGCDCVYYGEPNGCNHPDGNCGSYTYFTLVADRLAEYEDTGLTPAEVAELAQAKADGRVVVLPCKRGDMVYFIGINFTKCSAYGTEYDEVCCAGCEEPCDSEKTRNVYMTQAEDTRWILRRLNDFGRIYFLTREEAEKALRESDNNV